MFRKKKKSTLVVSTKSVQVVGTSHHQDDLRKIAGKKTSEGFDLPCIAALVPHPSNRHDSNAVSVQIEGHEVGHLSRDLAATVQPALNEFRKRTKTHVAVNAKIVGGWKRGRKDEGSYGVRAFFDLDAVRTTSQLVPAYSERGALCLRGPVAVDVGLAERQSVRTQSAG